MTKAPIIIARNAIPPTAPPAIAPTCLDSPPFGVEVGDGPPVDAGVDAGVFNTVGATALDLVAIEVRGS